MRHLFAALICLLLAAPAVARTITVDDDAPANFTTIQAAIDDASSGDTVEIRPGTYTGFGNRDIEFKGKAITVRSTDPNDPNIVAATIIDCNGTAEEPHRGFNFQAKQDANSVLAGLTITKGWAYYGGAICADYSAVTIRDCVLTGNTAELGGAIERPSGDIIRCTISNNRADDLGGGLRYCTGLIRDCIIRNNSARRGGGLWSSSGLIRNCTITGNSADVGGGGIIGASGGIMECTISNNQAGSYGGGLWGCSGLISNCLIKSNSADEGAGLFYCSAAISNCAILLNSATDYGGGLSNCHGAITNCTIVSNSAGAIGGGFYSCGTVANCIVYGNFAGEGYDGLYSSGPVAYSCIQDGDLGPGCINSDPNLAADRYHLLLGSPCISAGNPEFDYSTQTDIDGEPRVMGSGVEMGADEFTAETVLVGLEIIGPNELRAGYSDQYLAVSRYDDGSTRYVTLASTLSIDPQSHGLIHGDGFFTSATLDTDQDVTIQAEYRECAITLLAHKVVHIYVTPHLLLVPGQYDTIQAAVDAANTGDEIVVQPGTYTGDGNRDVDFLGKSITVRSTNPSDSSVVAATVIDSQGSPDDLHRAFILQNGEDANSVISGLTIKGGYADHGGAVCCFDSPGPAIRYCTIAANTACAGGGIYIAGEKTYPMIENCTIVGNRAIPNPNYALLEEGHGGGIFFVGYGGYGDTTSSHPTVANCTFTENVADYRGGGICALYNCEVTVTNSIVWGNTAPHDNDIGIPLVCDAPTADYIISYSNVKDGLDGIDVYYHVEWGNGNIDACPCFVEPGYWDPNATLADANDDFWVNGDYHLMSEGWRWDMPRKTWTWDLITSRCIDAGNPGTPLGDEPLSAPADPGNDWGRNLRIDMGAYGGTSEASIPPHDWMLSADITGDGYVHFDDLAAQVADWLSSGYERAGDFNRNALINLLDFAILAGDWPKQTTWAWQAWNPNPPDGSVDIRLDPALSWESGYAAVSHDVYFGAAYPPEFQTNQTTNTFAPGRLSTNTTYYWRIDEISPYETTTGSVWTFTTGAGTVR